MKKYFFILWIFASLLNTSLKAQTVYITNTGEKYHTGTCRYLSKSKIPIELSAALAQNYEACKVCKPTQTIKADKQETSNKQSQQQETSNKKPGTQKSESQQCTGTTKKGTRCKHYTYSPNGRCWQHGGS